MGPIFRWAGSKRKLIPALNQYVPKEIKTYYEPFCGSACLFFELMPKQAVLSDMNSELIFTYQQIQKQPEKVHEWLATFEVSQEQYLKIRSLPPEDLQDAHRAARFLYLNKLCFNGVYRTNQKGMFNVPMGNKTGAMHTLEQLIDYSKALQGVNFLASDYHSVIINSASGDFIYLDPPYSKPGNRNRGEYGPNSFHFSDIEKMMTLLGKLDERGVLFALSYCECEEIRDFCLPSWSIKTLDVKRHVAGFNVHRKTVKEVLITNQDILFMAA
ncbi:DNA adenine methylase [Stutzerimonas stutzeri]|uniref:DNA adenine methylase n=1 Tax=Stutzerimonas stutzeri TaxID=316 RepID=UPI000F788E35|nr:Dam family site-specific DNA-(adenine-N6)-methyltransferase [Stutzerimonas stutzeri]RSH69228.1 Dam family site-specific DNA-(adenine-N6)-methyltransferase [Stutzerimonas stutzeri]